MGEEVQEAAEKEIIGENLDCPFCAIQGKESEKIFLVGDEATCLGSISPPQKPEDPMPHTHDPNEYRYTFACSNGHQWTVAFHRPCWCNKSLTSNKEGPRVR